MPIYTGPAKRPLPLRNMNLITLPAFESNPEISEILEAAKGEELAGVAVLGFYGNGADFLTFGRLSSKDMLWLSEKLRQKALEILT